MRLSVLLVAACLLATGCSSHEKAPQSAVSAKPTPIEQLNTTSMRLARVRFCSLVPTDAVRDALGASSLKGTKASAWRNGDKAAVEPDDDPPVSDVVHEDGCAWTHGDVRASAWLFARSVSTEEARSAVADSARRQGCRSTASTTFGDPSQRQACRLPDGSRRVRISGLFGTTWLSCEVAAPSTTSAKDVRSRADAWCVQVANALNTTR